MAQDFIPRSDADAVTWARNFAAYGHAHEAELHLPPGAFDPIVAAADELAAAQRALHDARTAARAATQVKATARARFAALARAMSKRLQADPAVVGDAQKADLGLTIPDAVRRSAPVPHTRPQVIVRILRALRHELDFLDVPADSVAAPGRVPRRRRPRGAIGVQVWRALAEPGRPPAGDGDYRFVEISPRPPIRLTYPAAQAGRIAWYRLRWMNTRGQPGPFGVPAWAMIAA